MFKICFLLLSLFSTLHSQTILSFEPNIAYTINDYSNDIDLFTTHTAINFSIDKISFLFGLQYSKSNEQSSSKIMRSSFGGIGFNYGTHKIKLLFSNYVISGKPEEVQFTNNSNLIYVNFELIDTPISYEVDYSLLIESSEPSISSHYLEAGLKVSLLDNLLVKFTTSSNLISDERKLFAFGTSLHYSLSRYIHLFGSIFIGQKALYFDPKQNAFYNQIATQKGIYELGLLIFPFRRLEILTSYRYCLFSLYNIHSYSVGLSFEL